jgi:cysteine desulfurase
MHQVYLDNNATTPMLPEVLEAVRPYLAEKFGNPSSIYVRGREAHAALQDARDSVAQLLDCRRTEIVFTSGGTEGDNLAILGVVSPGDHIITSQVEHSAVLNCMEYLRDLGCKFTTIPVNGQGQVDPEDVRQALRPNTKLITIMLANNETGVLQPVEEIGKIAAESDAYFHVDAVQAAGKVPISVRRIGCDMLTISGHKIHAPQGTGALFVRSGTLLKPLFHGGHQEAGRRAGTENLPGIVGLGRACVIAAQGLADGTVERLREWRNRLENGILAMIDETGINGGDAPRVPNTSSIFFEHIGGESLVIDLDSRGISASAGAACSAGAREPSHVLLAMGLSPARARASLRFSLGKQNSAADIEYLLATLPSLVQRLRKLSPSYRQAVAVSVS